MRRKTIIQTAVVFLLIFAIVFFSFALFTLYQNSSSSKFSKTLKNFRSDFRAPDKGKALSRRLINKRNQFAAYGAYVDLPQGRYQVTFHFKGEAAQSTIVDLQIAAEKGKSILASQEIVLKSFPQSGTIHFMAAEEKEVEPRVLYRSGSMNFQIEKISVDKIKNIFPWGKIIFQALLISVLSALGLFTFLLAHKGDRKWTIFLAVLFFLIGCFLILRKAWVSEDAFITLRYVENFLNELGPVFNAGERVEGYSHPLWFAVVSFFRWLGLSAKGSVILPGLIASFSALYVLFFRIRFSDEPDSGSFLNLGAVILVGTSSFIDFGTSGLETPQSYLLLVIYAKFIAENKWKNQPVVMGLILSLLVLTRPDFGLFLLAFFCIYFVDFVRRRISLKGMAGFVVFPVILVGGWQIFRMGYYAALFPNPVYTKAGAEAYFSQGIKYLIDLFQGSLLWLVLMLAIAALLIQMRKPSFKNRAIIFFSGILHGFFVIRGGGDFMHGRYLLPAFILIAVSMSGVFVAYFQKKPLHRHAYIVLSLLFFFLSCQIQPVQLRGKYYNYGISNERLAYYQDGIVPLKYLFTDTVIFMWKTIGKNYKSLAQRTDADIRIAYNNVGYIGYYAGKRVFLIDKLGLNDPVIARIKLQRRERPGHEKHAPFGYLMLRDLTFSDTPFPVWNKIANTRFGIIWDLSPDTIRDFDFMLPKGFKSRLDDYIKNYLAGLNEQSLGKQADLLFFLKNAWYPHAGREGRRLFRDVYRENTVKKFSAGYKWIQKNQASMNELLGRISGPLSFKKFVSNILYAAGKGRVLKFDDQRFMAR